MAKISFMNINKSYPANSSAVRDFTLDVNDGEIVVLVGPSGCGKSSVLRMAAGLEKASGGEITIGGENVTSVSAKKRGAALLEQASAMKLRMNVNKYMSADVRALPDASSRVRRAAALVEIEDLMDRRLLELSGSERNRAALGRIIASDAKVLLLDEPFAGIDAALKARIISGLRRLGVTMICATSDVGDALALADRIVVMHDGAPQQIGAPVEVCAKPANRYVAGICGEPAMNIINAHLTPRDSKMYATFGDISLRIPDLTVKKLKSDIYIGKDICLGVRPANISDDPDFVAENQTCAFEAVVETVIPTGAGKLLCASAGGIAITACASPLSRAVEGDTVKLALDSAQIYMFDAKTGDNILFSE